MARLPRAESPDAIFHVYSRGNYRTDIFNDPGACGSFLTSTPFELDQLIRQADTVTGFRP